MGKILPPDRGSATTRIYYVKCACREQHRIEAADPTDPSAQKRCGCGREVRVESRRKAPDVMLPRL